MQYVLFDVETTGLSSKDEVISFCFLVFDSPKLDNCVYTSHKFCMSTMPIHPDAYKAHKLRVDDLRILSNGTFFEEYFEDFKKILEDDVIFIQYSNNLFDIRLINQTLTNANEDTFDFGSRVYNLTPCKGRHYFDAMTAMSLIYRNRKGSISLRDALAETRGYDEVALQQKFKALARRVPELIINQQGSDYFHSASYDTFCLWFLLFKNNERLLRNE